jgi:CheY-like chemotaxis protein
MNYKHHVFLSYSRQNMNIMARLCISLKNVGLTVWTDESLKPGTPSWQDEIEEAIEAAACVVAILTPEAKKSGWVKRELDYAIIQEVRIFPVLAQGDVRTSIPLTLISTHFADIRTDYELGVKNLAAGINELVGRLNPLIISDSKPREISTPNSGDAKISILLVDDIPETRESMQAILSLEADYNIAGVATTGREAVSLARMINPDIILMDINMPDLDGISATEIILRENPGIGVIIVSVQNDPEYLRRAMLAGARNFLTKPIDADELLTTVHAVNKARQKGF